MASTSQKTVYHPNAITCVSGMTINVNKIKQVMHNYIRDEHGEELQGLEYYNKQAKPRKGAKKESKALANRELLQIRSSVVIYMTNMVQYMIKQLATQARECWEGEEDDEPPTLMTADEFTHAINTNENLMQLFQAYLEEFNFRREREGRLFSRDEVMILLNEVFEGLDLSTDGRQFLIFMIDQIFEHFMNMVYYFVIHAERKTINDSDIDMAARIVLPEDYREELRAEASDASAKYDEHMEPARERARQQRAQKKDETTETKPKRTTRRAQAEAADSSDEETTKPKRNTRRARTAKPKTIDPESEPEDVPSDDGSASDAPVTRRRAAASDSDSDQEDVAEA